MPPAPGKIAAVDPLRLAVIGKGGVGKSLIAGTMARLLARRSLQVLALDVDTMPGLAQSIGMSPAQAGAARLPEAVGERQEGRGWLLKDGVEVRDLVDKYAKSGPDGLKYLQLGKLAGRVKQGSTTAFRAVLNQFRVAGWHSVAHES